MKKYEGKSIRKGKTNTGKIPDNVGQSKVYGVTEPKGIVRYAERLD